MKFLQYCFLVFSMFLHTSAHANLLALFTFDDQANLVADTSGNSLSAQNFGASYTASGYEGGGLAVNGVDQFVRVSLDLEAAVVPQMTWGAWVNLTDNSPIRQILSNDNGGFDRSIGIDFRGGTFGQFSAFTGNGVVGNGGVADLNQWTFVAAVYDNTTNNLIFWVDGNKVEVTNTNYNVSWPFFEIGHNPSHNEYFAGTIDNVFVFDEALSDARIQSIRLGGVNAISAVPEPEVLGLWLAGLACLGAQRKRSLSKL